MKKSKLFSLFFHSVVEYKLFLTATIVYFLFLRENGLGIRHFALVKSIVLDHSFRLDNFTWIFSDMSFYNGHYYLAAFPGPSFLAAPFYFILHFIFSFIHLNPAQEMRLSVYCLAMITNTIPTAYCGVLFLRMARRFTDTESDAIVGTLIFYFGTIIYFYATDFSLADNGGMYLCFVAFYMIFSYKNNSNPYKIFGASLALGLALLMTVPIFTTVFVLGFYALIVVKPKQYFLIIAPFAMCVFSLMIYNKICFDGFFSFFSSYNTDLNTNLSQNVLSTPDISRLLYLTFHQYRGFFFYMPIMFLFFPGVAKLVFHGSSKKSSLLASLKENRIDKTEIIVMISVFVVALLINASYTLWHAGASWGPRYLLGSVPYMLLLSLASFRYVSKSIIVLPLAFISFANNAFASTGLPLGRNLSGYYGGYLTHEFFPQLPIVQHLVISPLFPAYFHNATWVFIFSILTFFVWIPIIRWIWISKQPDLS